MLSDENKKNLSEQIKRFTDVRVIGLLIFGAVALLVTWSGLKVMQTNYELQLKEAELRQENQVTKLENENLRLKNVYFETEQYLELSARQHFNKAAEGEELYLIPESVAMGKTVDLSKSNSEKTQENHQKKSKYQQNFEAWVDFLFGQKG